MSTHDLCLIDHKRYNVLDLTLHTPVGVEFSFLRRAPHRVGRVRSLRTVIDRARRNGRAHYRRAPLKHHRAGHPDPPANIPAGVVVGVPSIPTAGAPETMPFALADGPAVATTLAGVRAGAFSTGTPTNAALYTIFVSRSTYGQ